MLIENVGRFLLEVDRLKSHGRYSDAEILIGAYKKMLELGKTPEEYQDSNEELTWLD